MGEHGIRVRDASFGITALMTLLSSLLQARNDPSQQQFTLYEKNDRLFRVSNWAFQLPQRHLLPTGRDGSWTIFDLELFILRQLDPKVL